VTTETVFRVGSVSKLFTATAVMKLHEDGLLDIDENLTNALPGFRIQARFDATNVITLRDMLSHHSGLPGDLLHGAFTTKPYDGCYPWITNYLTTTYPTYPPRLVYNYCNTAFTLMEGVVANIHTSSLPFTAAIAQDLFEPLGMTGTSFFKDKPAISNHLSRAYLNGYLFPEEYPNIYGTGGMYSRPTDLAQYIKMVFSNGVTETGVRILDTNTLAMMLSPQGTNIPLNEFTWMKTGLGWDTVTYPMFAYAGPVAFKTGATMTHSAIIQLCPDLQLGVAVAANSRLGSLPCDAADRILQLAIRDKTGTPWPTNDVYFPTATQAVSQAELDALAGLYVTEQGYSRIESTPGALRWVLNAGQDGSAVMSDLVLKTNGWFSVTNQPVIEMTVSNIAGRTALVYRTAQDSTTYTGIYGERCELPMLTEAWSNRLGQEWFAVDRHEASYLTEYGIGPRLTFTNREGLLIVKNDYGGIEVLSPTNGDTAFVCGLNNRGGSTLRVYERNGQDYIQHYGIQYAPAPGVMAANTSETGVVARAGACTWYELRPVVENSNLIYELTLSVMPTNFRTRLFNASGGIVLDEIIGGNTLQFIPNQAPLYAQVQPLMEGVQTGAFQLAYIYPLLVRDVRREGTNTIISWQGETNISYSLNAADDLRNPAPFTPIQPGIVPTNRYNVTTNPPGPDSCRYFRIERE
jgi:CubicO group peptidase (beta-lactamase class C family)